MSKISPFKIDNGIAPFYAPTHLNTSGSRIEIDYDGKRIIRSAAKRETLLREKMMQKSKKKYQHVESVLK